jgi:hypothetical protein
MQPINYMLDVQQPLQMALAGYTQGQGIRANQQGMEDQRRLMEMQEMQFAQQQQAIQQQQARAQEMQMDMADYAETVRSGTVTPQTIVELTSKYPEMAESIQGNWAMLSEAQKTGKIDDYTRLISALDFDPAVAMGMIDERIIAAESAGDAQQVNLLKAVRAQAEIDPAAVKASLLPELALAMDPKQFEQYISTVNPPAPEAASTAGKILADYKAGAYGAVGSPEAMQIRDQQLEKAGGGASVNVTVPGGVEEGAFEKKVGELQATSIGAIADMGITARRNRQTLNQLDTALAESAGGFEAGFKSALGDFGIATQGLTEIQAAQALISQLVPAQRPPGSGTMSDRDLDLFKKSLPRLIQTPEGRRKIIENMKAINQYMIAEGDLADAVLDGTITRAQYREQMRALGNPLAGTAASGTGAAPARRRFDAQGREIK